MTNSAAVPWQLKMLAKIVLSRLPASYAVWRKVHLFAHGEMDDPAYAIRVFEQHIADSSFARKGGRFVGMELGPGDSLLSAVVAAAHGASRYYLVDSGSYAGSGLSPYLAMSEILKSRGKTSPIPEAVTTVSEILQSCGAQYFTNGLADLRQLPSRSVDFIWSNAVLEHIRYDEFAETSAELRRILAPGGCCSHQVDLKDHLGGGLNNLRFTRSFWERDWVARSGFYTNRIRYTEMLRIFRASGFDVEVKSQSKFSSLPIPRAALAREFLDLDDDSLMVSGFRVLLR